MRVGRGSDNWPGWMNDLDSSLCCNRLEDLRFAGHFFTWHNKQESAPIMCKLDRVVVNGCWKDLFGASEAVFLPAGVSDHSYGGST